RLLQRRSSCTLERGPRGGEDRAARLRIAPHGAEGERSAGNHDTACVIAAHERGGHAVGAPLDDRNGELGYGRHAPSAREPSAHLAADGASLAIHAARGSVGRRRMSAGYAGTLRRGGGMPQLVRDAAAVLRWADDGARASSV